ncbi:hypothetical protein OIU78_023813 [Salix suchowensis]|nr:hypothetical protein OIU78_023813 [Salix suchowensis]
MGTEPISLLAMTQEMGIFFGRIQYGQTRQNDRAPLDLDFRFYPHTQYMASHGNLNISTSPESGNGEGVGAAGSGSPKGQCLCSPTTHQGSFRCRLHRSRSSAASMMKRSKSMPPKNAPTSLSPKSVEST